MVSMTIEDGVRRGSKVQGRQTRIAECGVDPPSRNASEDRFSVPLESNGVGGEVLAVQPVRFSRGAASADANSPNSHIFPPFLTSSMWEFFGRLVFENAPPLPALSPASGGEGVDHRKLCEQGKLMQKQGFKIENRTGNMLARNSLTMESSASCRLPPRRNVRLLFA